MNNRERLAQNYCCFYSCCNE